MNAPVNSLVPSFDCVPVGLKAVPRWIGWRLVERNGDMRKVPQGTSGNIDAHKSENWMTFTDAVTFLGQRLASGKWPLGGGIGFVFSDDDDIGGVDLDGCRDPETGQVAAWAERVLSLFEGAYVEYSPSGTGFHVITRGAPDHLDRTQRKVDIADDDLTVAGKDAFVEAYVSKRFFTVTGDHAAGGFELIAAHEGWEQIAAYLRGERSRQDRDEAREPSENADPELVRSALAAFGSDEVDRNLFVAIGMALKGEFGEEGRDMWLEWMARSPNDDPDVSEEIWCSLPDKAHSVGIGTIFHYATRNGWKRSKGTANGSSAGGGDDAFATIMSGLELWHDPRGIAFATVTVRKSDASSHRENMPVEGSAFSNWLSREFYLTKGKPPKRDPLKDAISLAVAKAIFDGQQHETWIRAATGENGKLYLDIGDEEWQAIEIDANGWRIVSDPPVKFRRSGGSLPLPMPERGNAADGIAKLGELIQPKNPDHLKLVVGVMVACLRSGYPVPGLVFDCEPGSAKTEALKTTRMFIDPHVSDTPGLPKNEEDLLVAANAQWLPCFDNVANMSRGMSDALCRLVTGGGKSGRKLYKDDEAHHIAVMRSFVMSAVESPTMMNDFIDRTITIPLARIEKYIPLRQFEKRRAEVMPVIMGALLDGASSALRRLDEVEEVHIGKLPRMADFALWVEAAGQAFGWEDGEFIAAYNNMLDERMAKNAADNPLCILLREWLFVTEGGVAEGPAVKLLDRLHNFANIRLDRDRSSYGEWFPKTPRGLSSRLKADRRLLASIGISYEAFSPENTEAMGDLHRLGLNERGHRMLAKRQRAAPEVTDEAVADETPKPESDF